MNDSEADIEYRQRRDMSISTHEVGRRCRNHDGVLNRAGLAVGLCVSVVVTCAGCGALDLSLCGWEGTARPATVAAKLNELATKVTQGLQAARLPRSAIATVPVEESGCGGMWKTVTGDPLTTISPYGLKIEIKASVGSRSSLLRVLPSFRRHLQQAGWKVTEDEAAPQPSEDPGRFRPLRLQKIGRQRPRRSKSVTTSPQPSSLRA